jgi:F-type H+-transporting ATPase subunit b
MLTIEPGLLIWTIITFVILVAVLGKLAWKPLLGALEQRETTIRESLEKAEQARSEAEQLMVQNQRILAEANQQANRILAQAQEEGHRLRESLSEQARQDSVRLREETRQELQRERRLAVQELKKTASDLALAATERLLSTVVTSDDHRRIVDEYLERFPDGLDG